MGHTITLVDKPDELGRPVKFEFTYPGSWSDESLTPRHLEVICRVHASPRHEAAKRFTLLRELAEIPGRLMGRMPPASDLMLRVDVTDHSGPFRPVEKFEWQLLPSLNWAFAPPKYERSLFSEVTHNGKRWLGPWDQFDHMVLAQWIFCTTLLKNMRETKIPAEVEQQMNLFLGALFVPAPNGEHDVREDHKARGKWSNDPIETYATELAGLSVEQKLAAVLNFEAIHANLPVLYWRVFDPSGEVQQSPQGLFGMAYSVAESGVFGDIYSADSAPLHRVLGYMEHKLYEDAVAAERAKTQK